MLVVITSSIINNLIASTLFLIENVYKSFISLCRWCFYNSEDSLIYKYIISPETYNDINLYAELLKIDNEELNNLLLKHEEHKAVFDSSSYKHFW